MKRIWKQLVTGCLVAAWMVVIFCFSAQQAEESSALSGSVAYNVVDTTDHVLRMQWSGQQIFSYARMLEHPIRKAAHMTEYAILGLLCYMFYASLGKKGKADIIWHLRQRRPTHRRMSCTSFLCREEVPSLRMSALTQRGRC